MADGTRCCPNLQRWLTPALFKALGEPTRLGLLAFLADGGGERTVSELGGCCPVDLSVVSRHLRVLREAGVVEARKQGKEVLYRVRSKALAGILRGLADALEDACAQPLQATDVGQLAPRGETT
jgi:ArsR family transcriptional regulator